MKKSVVVKMQQDFEARPIANLVQVANRYESKIYLEHGDSRVNAKSIMGMMSLALLNGEEILVDAEGADEAEAVAAIEDFLVS
ncbi:MAG: HPr family phosphocarrier protein [Roseburia hominis]|uniref:HPr family phosphocarrier protein n=1 Tax=Roseburia hominis TaxID=301301 RepID=UPI0026EF4F34|nr:HPr family phosphocarrier protein [Roseburia hominis]MCI7521805.1 HPr family phosphocarrier protein [Roseburia hominis]MDD6242600.1 HPr family phosphocarrier protein [Roseburia hominis]